jgi:pyruvate ferredoxin oxidoreductase gamma subunit
MCIKYTYIIINNDICRVKNMDEIRFHGRGGQGAVTAAEILAIASLKEGKFCQAFPFFGPEKRGAPVTSYVRISDSEIKTRTQIYNPNYVMVLDPTVINDPTVDVVQGLNNGTIIVNTKRPIEFEGQNTYTIDATKLAIETLGVPITNTVMIGAFLAIYDNISLDSVISIISERFPKKLADKNILAVKRAYDEMKKVVV